MSYLPGRKYFNFETIQFTNEFWKGSVLQSIIFVCFKTGFIEVPTLITISFRFEDSWALWRQRLKKCITKTVIMLLLVSAPLSSSQWRSTWLPKPSEGENKPFPGLDVKMTAEAATVTQPPRWTKYQSPRKPTWTRIVALFHCRRCFHTTHKLSPYGKFHFENLY